MRIYEQIIELRNSQIRIIRNSYVFISWRWWELNPRVDGFSSYSSCIVVLGSWLVNGKTTKIHETQPKELSAACHRRGARPTLERVGTVWSLSSITETMVVALLRDNGSECWNSKCASKCVFHSGNKICTCSVPKIFPRIGRPRHAYERKQDPSIESCHPH